MARGKHRLLFLGLFGLCAILAAGGTQAFYTVNGVAHNVITTGDVSIRIHETTSNGMPFPVEGILDVLPGTDQDKQVTVVNTGRSSRSGAWVRARVTVAVTAANGSELPNTIATDSGPHAVAVPNYNTRDWLFDNGWYYYHTSLSPGKATSPLFTQVHFDSQIGNDYQGCQVRLHVQVQAVQAENHPLPPGGVTQITGWPTESAL